MNTKNDLIIGIRASETAKTRLIDFAGMLGCYAVRDELMPFVYVVGLPGSEKRNFIEYLRDLSKELNFPEPTMNEFENYRTSPGMRVLQLQVKGYGLLRPEELHPVMVERKSEPAKTGSRQNIEGAKSPFVSKSGRVETRRF